MSVSNKFVLDASVFIQAHRAHYAFDICPGFWSSMTRAYHSGNVISIDKVKAELVDEGDELSKWVKTKEMKDFFRGTADQSVLESFGEMQNWVHEENRFTQDAKADFAAVADGWLIAFAKVNDLILVTHEQYAPDAKRIVKIPNVCIEFDIAYCNTFDMLRRLEARFILNPRRRSH